MPNAIGWVTDGDDRLGPPRPEFEDQAVRDLARELNKMGYPGRPAGGPVAIAA